MSVGWSVGRLVGRVIGNAFVRGSTRRTLLAYLAFLGATKHLYITGCVRWLVGWSGSAFVRGSTRRTLLANLALFHSKSSFGLFNKQNHSFEYIKENS